MSFTKAQENAINARGRTLLVCAAAGSGKTYTLTHRIIKAITEEKRNIDRMLIVTFTRAAAGELRVKIAKAIGEAIAQNPDDPHLQSQLLKLGGARISTIDSFFSEPVRANFEKLGLPASLRLSDESELTPIRESIINSVLERFFDERSGISEGQLPDVGHRTAFTDLLSLVSGARDSSTLVPTLLLIYQKLCTSPRGVHQLIDHADRMKRAAGEDFFLSAEGEVIKEQMREVIEHTRLILAKCIEEMEGSLVSLERDYVPPSEEAPTEEASSKPKKTKKKKAEEDDPSPPPARGVKKLISDYRDDDTRCLLFLEALKSGYADTCTAFSAKQLFKTITTLAKDEVSEISDSYKKLRSEILAPVKALSKSNLFRTPEEASEQFAMAATICRTLGELLLLFDQLYSEEKRSRGLCEFSDMPKFMLRLLQNSDGTPTPFADSMAKDFDEVYIDEYQDVNEIQDRIFTLIGRNRRFMVGDIKQSIYSFREAEPSIFASYRKRFSPYDPKDETPIAEDSGSSIFMSENFRCDETVVNFSNLVCSVVFSAFAESIGYTSDDDLVFKKNAEDKSYIPTRVVLNLVHTPQAEEDEEGDAASDSIPPVEADAARSEGESQEDSEDPTARYRDEAIVTANEIARLCRDKNERLADGSRITPGKIAILVRGHSLVKPLSEALNALNIKYVTTDKSALFDSAEMHILAELLTVIDNPRNDVPLCKVLTGEAPSLPALFTLDEVITIRKNANSSRSLYDALLLYAEQRSEVKEGKTDPALASRCAEFVSSLEAMRHTAARLPADKLLRSLAGTERYGKLCHSDAFTYLYSCACQYVRRAWNGLYSFITYLGGILEKGDASLEPASANGDAVKIMTIHQSKGLEFPVCFLFGLSKGFNFKEIAEPLVFSRAFGLSMKLPPKETTESTDPYSLVRRKKEKSLLNRAASLNIKNNLAEEEARVLYVALTRARERLYLSGTLKGDYAQAEAEILSRPDSAYTIKSATDYLQWVLQPIAKLGRETKDYTVRLFESGQVTLCEPLGRADLEQTQSSAFTEEDKEFARELLSPHGRSEEERLLANIPAKVAASKVSGRMLDESIFLPIPAGLLFSEGDEDRDEADNETARAIRNRIRLMRSQKPDFDSLLTVGAKPTAAERGTAIHQFLQFCDYSRVASHGIEEEAALLSEKRFISRRTAEILDTKLLAPFFESELFERIKHAKQIRREFRFGMFLPASRFTENKDLASIVADKRIFVQGSIDLLIETAEGELLVCDYKTDRVSAEERANPTALAESMKEKHGEQLKQYRYAVKEIFGKAPKALYIYSVPLGELIEIE